MSVETIFTDIYRKNKWSGVSRSGPGSELQQTETIRALLPELFKELQATSLLDIPCGDFFWLKEINLDFLSYVGADIVEDIIRYNRKHYSSWNRTFIKLDILTDILPKVELILCRDLLVHFSFNDIFKAVKNIRKSGSKYLLTTSFMSTAENHDIVTGTWHPLNLLLPPFSFPRPIKIIDEKSPVVAARNKSLILWNVSDL